MQTRLCPCQSPKTVAAVRFQSRYLQERPLPKMLRQPAHCESDPVPTSVRSSHETWPVARPVCDVLTEPVLDPVTAVPATVPITGAVKFPLAWMPEISMSLLILAITPLAIANASF